MRRSCASCAVSARISSGSRSGLPMVNDARFADAGPDAALAIRAEDADDLRVLAALAQDAVLSVGDMGYDPKSRRFSLLLSRFRWEDADSARRESRPFERVR